MNPQPNMRVAPTDFMECACARVAPSRRGVLGAGLGLAALLAGCASAGSAPRDATSEALTHRPPGDGRRILLKGGMVLTMDRRHPDMARGDVLMAGKRIEAVGVDLPSNADMLVVDASGMVVMPGFIDTHHHQYQTALRSILSDGALGLYPEDGPENYRSVIQQLYTPLYTPEDAYIAELVASWSQLSAGVTTTVDTSQVSLSPAHTDACIAGLRDSGRRAVFSYAAGGNVATSKFPQDIVRLRREFFASDDQLLTLALSARPLPADWALARSVGAPIVSHIVGKAMGNLEQLAPHMGPDNEYIHCTQLSDKEWKLIQDTGGKVSIAAAIEMQMRHGMPPLQKALDLGLRPSLSVDVESNMAADMFTVMRAAFTVQRALASEQLIAKKDNPPRLMTSRQVIEAATIDGAYVAHLEKRTGSLTPGKEADVLLLDARMINVMPLNNVPGAVVTLMDTSNVMGVFVAGQVKKWQGKLVGVDVGALRRQIESSRDGLLARAKRQPRPFDGCCTN